MRIVKVKVKSIKNKEIVNVEELCNEDVDTFFNEHRARYKDYKMEDGYYIDYINDVFFIDLDNTTNYLYKHYTKIKLFLRDKRLVNLLKK